MDTIKEIGTGPFAGLLIMLGAVMLLAATLLTTAAVRRLLRWRRERRAARAVPQPGYTWAHFNERDYWNDVHPLIVLESTINPPAPKPIPYGSRVPDDAQPVRLDAHRELEARVAALEARSLSADLGRDVRAWAATTPTMVRLWAESAMWCRINGVWEEDCASHTVPYIASLFTELPRAEALALYREWMASKGDV